MTSTTDSKQFSWSNLPSEGALMDMSSLDLLVVIRNLETTKPTPPPAAAIAWLMENVQVHTPEEATDTLLGVTYPLRHTYILRLHAMADLAFKREPQGAQNNALFEDLNRRQHRLHASVNLGLRTEEEEKIISKKQHTWYYVVISEDDLCSYKGSAHRAELFAEKLAVWERTLEEVEKKLQALDAPTVLARIDEELNKPFSPSKQKIENTRAQMGSYDNNVDAKQALKLLQRENQEHLDILIEWRADINGAANSAPKRPGP